MVMQTKWKKKQFVARKKNCSISKTIKGKNKIVRWRKSERGEKMILKHNKIYNLHLINLLQNGHYNRFNS